MRSDGQLNFALCDSDDGKVGNLFFFGRDSGQGSGENIFAIVIPRTLVRFRGSAGARTSIFVLGVAFRNAHKCELCVPPGELAVAEARVQGDLASRALGNVQAVVHGVGSAWRNQVDVNAGTRGPRIAFVDGIAVFINLQRAIEVRAGFDRAFAVVL